MFTGIVEELGEIVGKEDLVDAARFEIRGPVVTSDAGHGDSIAVNGVSLTVCNPTDDTFQVAIIPYTFEHTNFHAFKKGSVVNLEFDIIGKYISRMIQYK